jgi:hypothetical protein
VTAFNISLGGWILCAVFLGLMAFTIGPDEEALARQLRELHAQEQMALEKRGKHQQQQALPPQLTVVRMGSNGAGRAVQTMSV